MFRDLINWKEAFNKYGFGDGAECEKTDVVARFLKAKGYEARTEEWGPHNIVFGHIAKDDVVIMDSSGYNYEEDPAKQIGEELVQLLDGRFGKGEWFL